MAWEGRRDTRAQRERLRIGRQESRPMCFHLLFHLLDSLSLSLSVFSMTSAAELWLDNEIIIITKKENDTVDDKKTLNVIRLPPRERVYCLLSPEKKWISPIRDKRDNSRRVVSVLQRPGDCLWTEGRCYHPHDEAHLTHFVARGAETPSESRLSSASDMHLGNLKNSCLCSQPKHLSAHMTASIKQISDMQLLQTFLFTPMMCMYTFTCTVVYRGSFFPVVPTNLTGMLAAQWGASRQWICVPPITV